MSEKRVAAVVLAAGRSSRMGTPKQLLKIDGKTLLRRTVLTVLAARFDLVVVVSHFGSEIEDLPVVQAAFYSEPNTLSDSIKNGLSVIRDWEECENSLMDAALFVPCDLPLLSSAHLDALIERYQDGIQIVASRYEHILGTPMLLGRVLWKELDELQGDAGGRQIIARHAEATASVEFPGGGFDLDTPEDVEAFQRAR